MNWRTGLFFYVFSPSVKDYLSYREEEGFREKKKKIRASSNVQTCEWKILYESRAWFFKMVLCLSLWKLNIIEIRYSWASLVAKDGKEPACNAEGSDLIPGSGRSTEEGNGSSIPFLENSMNRGAWEVHGATKNLSCGWETPHEIQ